MMSCLSKDYEVTPIENGEIMHSEHFQAGCGNDVRVIYKMTRLPAYLYPCLPEVYKLYFGIVNIVIETKIIPMVITFWK